MGLYIGSVFCGNIDRTATDSSHKLMCNAVTKNFFSNGEQVNQFICKHYDVLNYVNEQVSWKGELLDQNLNRNNTAATNTVIVHR